MVYASCKTATILFLINLLSTILCSNQIQHDPVVSVKEGKLRGAVGNLVDGSIYYSFKGIPYATPPIGNLRFGAPLPPKPWNGIRNAVNFGSICTQFNSTLGKAVEDGSEDCLFLNVYTKSLDKNAKIPVMVFIHGGSYNEGSGNFFLPDFLLQHDVILVTMNYRLELLGFLSLDTPKVPGNAGLKDQAAALRWVQSNIINFGGDPNSVTLFGESSGASSVTFHMLSPMSRGLFHRVIAQSGVCIQDWAIGVGARDRAFRAGKILGKDTKDVDELLAFFRSLPPNSLTNLTFATLTADETYRGLPPKFVPVVEKKFPNNEAFIDENPINILTSGNITRVPLMLGYNSGEGLIIVKYHEARLDVYNKNPSYYVPRDIAEKVSSEQLEKLGDRFKKFYVGNRNITKNDSAIIRDMQTDLHFAYNTHRFANLYAALCESTFMYRFNFVTELNIIKNSLGLADIDGVSHADDLFYLFYNFANEKQYKNQKRLRDIVFKVTKLWTDFAKNGNPTPDNSVGAVWKAYTRSGKEYFNIDQPFSTGQYADRERMEFLDNIYAMAGLSHIVSK